MSAWVKRIYDYYTKRGLIWPTTEEAMLWLATEVGEACEHLLSSCDSVWLRNDPEAAEVYSDEQFAEELGDVIMMAMVAGMTVGSDPLEALESKMERKLKEVGDGTTSSTCLGD